MSFARLVVVLAVILDVVKSDVNAFSADLSYPDGSYDGGSFVTPNQFSVGSYGSYGSYGSMALPPQDVPIPDPTPCPKGKGKGKGKDGKGKGKGKGKACNIVPCNLCRQPMQVRTVHMQHTCAHYSAHFPHFSEATATFKLTN